MSKKPKGPYLPPYPLVEIIWNDAASNPTTWVPLEDIEGHEQVRSVGFLVKEGGDFIALAGSVSNEDIEDETVGNTLSIPRGMIVSTRTIRQGSKARKAKKRKSSFKPVGPKPEEKPDAQPQ
jgi:hypothetical protein